MFYLYIQHRNKHEACHLKGQILNWRHCSNIFPCNEKQKHLRQSNLSLPFLALLCIRELGSRGVSGLVYLCLLPVQGMPKGWNLCRMSSWPLLLGMAEPGPWSPCSAVGLGTWSTSRAHRWGQDEEWWHQLISKPKRCQDLAGTKAERSGKQLAERWYNCSAEHSHNGSCNHRGKRVSVWNTISAFFV